MARRVALVGLAVLVGAGVGWRIDARSDADEPDREIAAVHEVERVDAPRTPEPADLSQLTETVEVVETGFTAGIRVECSNSSDMDPSDGCYGCSVAQGCHWFDPTTRYPVSYGTVIRNSGDRLLIRLPVTIQFVDGAGQPINEAYPIATELTRLLPGEEVGLGQTTELERPGVAEVRVEVGPPAEWSTEEYATAAGDVWNLIQVTDDPAGALRSGDMPREWLLTFHPAVSIPEDLPASMANGVLLSTVNTRYLRATANAIFRDAGHIVGGDSRLVTIGLAGSAGMSIDLAGVELPIDSIQTDLYFTNVAAEV